MGRQRHRRAESLPDVTLLPRATVNGYHDHNFLTIHERLTDHLGDRAPIGQVRHRVHRVRAKRVVLATGAHERPLVYGNNDVPGNMLAGAVSTYVRRYGVAPGRSWCCRPTTTTPTAPRWTGTTPACKWWPTPATTRVARWWKKRVPKASASSPAAP
jgi:NADPH-dependent 2,4-dienoyl-CoA reductase/sulfur reductase-like enzyme